MNICIISVVMPGNSIGGIEDHTLMLSQELVKLGHRVTVITAAAESKEYEENGGVLIYYLSKAKSKKYTKNYSQEWISESVKKFVELHEKQPFDIIHGQERSVLHFIKDKINIKFNVPIVVTLHTTVYDDIKTRINIGFSKETFVRDISSVFWCLFYQWAKGYFFEELILAKYSDGIICTSDQQESIFRSIFHLRDGQYHKVYNGINTGFFRSEKTKHSLNLKLQEGEKMILSIARLERDKGLQYLLKAMPRIVEKNPSCKLIIAGDGTYRDFLMKQWQDHPNKEKIIFLGFQNIANVKYLLNACYLYVNPTIRQNGYDLIMAEAMACKKPVISSNIGSTPTLIRHNIDGLLFETKNLFLLSKCVDKLLKDKSLADELGKSGQQRVMEHFSSEDMARKTEQVYLKVIDNVRQKRKNQEN